MRAQRFAHAVLTPLSRDTAQLSYTSIYRLIDPSAGVAGSVMTPISLLGSVEEPVSPAAAVVARVFDFSGRSAARLTDADSAGDRYA